MTVIKCVPLVPRAYVTFRVYTYQLIMLFRHLRLSFTVVERIEVQGDSKYSTKSRLCEAAERVNRER